MLIGHHPQIAVACTHELDEAGVVTIASRARLLVQSKTVTEDGLGFVLLQHGSFLMIVS